MANLDSPFGLRPVKHLNGNPFNGQTMKCYVGTGDATAIFLGDYVDLNGGACVKGCCPYVVRGSAADAGELLGVLLSCDPVVTGQGGYHPAGDSTVVTTTVYRLASTDRYLNVVVDPNVMYEIQGDSATATDAGNAGSNFDFVETHSGSTVTGLSGIELDISTDAEDKSNQFWCWGTVDRPDTNLGANDILIGLLNTSIFTGTLGRVLGVSVA